ncbi:retrovirus-related pol polyprotein from transposon TNT 1-94 [Tanacetum coccineum]
MSRMQLNSKFVNNMLPEWGRFVTAVKLNRGLRDSNYDQLYAYLKQHEAHVNENKMMLDRFTQHTMDPLALMLNVSHQQHYSQSSTTPPSSSNKTSLFKQLYKQDQSLQTPALYNGYEIIQNNHVLAIVHNTYDTLEIAEITRRKMNDKMKDPKCVINKVKIAPPDYSKENYLATFTPQKQLTPEQIFWSQDLIKMKAEALKKQTTASRPIKALMVYLPNTPAMLVPREMLSHGGHSFFKTLKEHFEGIQKALTKDIKELKDVFEELEAEVDQNVVDRKHDEIERKNLLIAHDNLIVDCLSKEVFYVATNYELNVSRFTEMHDAHTIVEACCLELEAELSNLRDKIQNDNHNELVKRFSNLEITRLTKKVTVLQEQNELFRAENAKIKQHYKELYDSIKITRAKHIEQTTALTTENENLKAQIQTKMKSVTKDHVKPIVFAPSKYAIDVELITPRNMNNREVHLDYLRHLKESVETLREIVEEAKVERPLDRKHTCYVRDTDGVELIKGSRGSNLYTISVEDMMKSSLIYLLSKASKNKSWLWHRRLNHLNFGTINDLVRKDLVRGLPRLKFEKDHLCSAFQLGKSKKHTHKPKPENTNLEVLNTLHMDLCGPMRVQTINGKRYILVIVDDYSRFTWVKFLRSKDETPAFIIKFLKQIQTVPRTPQQNGIVERQNRTLVEVAKTMLIFSKAPMFLWAEAMATACYTQNRSLIHTRHDKTPYELVHDKKPDLTFFCVFGALCYPTNDNEDLGKLQPTADIGIFVGYAPSRKGYRIYNKRTR